MKTDAIESALLARGLWSQNPDLRRKIAESLAGQDFEPEMVEELYGQADRQNARAPDALVASWLKDGTWVQAADRIEKRRFSQDQNASGRYWSRHDTVRDREQQAACFADRHGLDPELCREVHLANLCWGIAHHDMRDVRRVAGPKLWRHLLDSEGRLLPITQRPELGKLLPPESAEDAPGEPIPVAALRVEQAGDAAEDKAQAIERGAPVTALDRHGELTPASRAEIERARVRAEGRDAWFENLTPEEQEEYRVLVRQRLTEEAQGEP